MALLLLTTGAASSAPPCTFLADTDFQPGDVGSSSAATADICCARCAADAKCAAGVWNGPKYKTCYLKDKYAKPTHSPGATACVPKPRPAPPLPPHPPPLPAEDPCVTVTSGGLALCIGQRSGRVRSATLHGQLLALSTWAGPIECNGLNDTTSATVRTEPDGSVIVTRTVCGGGGGGAPAPDPVCAAPAQPGMALGGGDLHNLQLPKNASASACGAACCAVQKCTGFSFVSSGSVENGACTDHTRPCCWLKAQAGMHPAPSSLPGIVSGMVSGRRPSATLPHPVWVEERFTPEPVTAAGGGDIVRWALNFSAATSTAAATSPPFFGSASLDSWLTLGGELGSANTTKLWAPCE
jgi:hypothetical protein